jgi:colanic acid biosynthesis glycosyl transferase WcaI
MRRRILVWSPNYAPELTGIPPLVTDAAEWLQCRGHSVEVVTPVPNYPERRIHDEYRGRLWMSESREGVLVHRSWLRVRPAERFVDKALYELTASTVSLPRVLRRLSRSDVLLCVVPTLLAAAYATHLPGEARVILWVQDLVASAAGSLGLGRLGRAGVAGASALERSAVRAADRVIVCSPGFRDHFICSGVEPAKIELIYNWVDLDWIAGPRNVVASEQTRFLYAGNIGYTQGLETLLDATRIVGDRITVDIVGAGNAEGQLARLAKDVPNVTLRAPVSREAYPALLVARDVHVVVQRRVSAGANLPSKIASYLASGRPIVASIDAATPAAEMLRESGGALLVEPESPDELARAMVYLHERPELRADLGAKSRAYAEARLGKEAALRRLEEVVCE